MREDALNVVREALDVGEQINKLIERRCKLSKLVLVPGVCLKLKDGRACVVYDVHELGGGVRVTVLFAKGSADFLAWDLFGEVVDVRYDLFDDDSMREIKSRLNDMQRKGGVT